MCGAEEATCWLRHLGDQTFSVIKPATPYHALLHLDDQWEVPMTKNIQQPYRPRIFFVQAQLHYIVYNII